MEGLELFTVFIGAQPTHSIDTYGAVGKPHLPDLEKFALQNRANNQSFSMKNGLKNTKTENESDGTQENGDGTKDTAGNSELLLR